MKPRARLAQLAERISEKPKDDKLDTRKMDILEANPPHGEKGDFVKITITLPPTVYELLARETTRRKMVKEPNPNLSAVIREAVVHYLEREV